MFSPRSYLTRLAGKYLGFDQQIGELCLTILDLQTECDALKTECRSLNDAINTMDEKYMDKYRELEKSCVGSREAPMNIKLYDVTHRQPEYTFAIMHMGLSPLREDEILSPARKEVIKLAEVSMGFSFDPNEKHPEAYVHQTAVTFARKAADMAYDAVMERYGHRIKVKNPLDYRVPKL